MTDTTIVALATSYTVLTIVSVGSLFMTSWWMRDAKDDAKRYAAQAATLTEENKASAALVSDLAGKLKTANARVEALDVENAKLRAERPVAGSDSVLSSEAAAAHPSGGVVSHVGASDRTGLDDLRPPGE